MRQKKIRVSICALMLAAPVAMWAFSTGPPIARTGAAVDGGLNCTACHRSFVVNSGAGRLIINAAPYTPGVKQIITIMNTDPDARRWGFQITARLKSDDSKPAGTFTASDLVRVRCDPDGHDAPCNGAKEFAEHTQPYTQAGTPPPGIHRVEWTPPSEDVGEVIFYAAGNAANGDGTPNGDHIYTTSFVIPSAICNVTDKPSVTGVESAAGIPTISSDALVSIYGGPFTAPGASYPVTAGDLRDGKLPSDQFRCVAVEINGKRAPLIYVSSGQINAQAPFIDLNGTVDVRVIANPGSQKEIRGDAMKVQVTIYAPAFFTFDGHSIAAINMQDGTPVANSAVVAGASPGKPGATVSLYGTGFGVSDPVWQPGEFPDSKSPLRDAFTISIGGTTLAKSDILYAGLSGELPGLYRFDVRLPASLPDGDAPVVVRIGSQQTQSGAVIAVKK